jgi:ubiquitin-like domain-containing CTD phosphatase 1
MGDLSSLAIKWSGKEFLIPVSPDDTVLEFKRKVADQINVPPKRQKVIGLKFTGGRLAADDVRLSELNLKPGAKLMVLG